MNERVVAVLSFIATAIADTDTVTTPCTVDTTATAPAAKPFLWVPYVILAVVVLGLFGVSFAWYHIRHRNSHTARVRTARLHGSRVADSSTCSRPWTISGSETASASWTRMPRYAKSGDVKKVLASMYQDDRKHLIGPDGKLRTQRVGDMSTGRRASSSDIEGSLCSRLCLPESSTDAQLSERALIQRAALKSPSTSSLLSLALDPPTSTQYRSIDFIFDRTTLAQHQMSTSLTELKVPVGQY